MSEQGSATPPSEPEGVGYPERVRRLERAMRTLSWWLVDAQTGFAERDARGIERILDGTDEERVG